jgi:hypothetical protein
MLVGGSCNLCPLTEPLGKKIAPSKILISGIIARQKNSYSSLTLATAQV